MTPRMTEAEIRPREMFNAFLECARRDVQRFFSARATFVAIDCPACGSAAQEAVFDKLGMPYAVCRRCSSLFLSPRPPLEAFARYQREGESVAFWSERFYVETQAARWEKIYRPRADLVRRLTRFLSPGPWTFADVGSGVGLFLQEVAGLGLFADVVGIEPAPNMAQASRARGFRVVERLVEDVDPGEVQADLITAFEVLEHVYTPARFLSAIARLLRPGGLLLCTTLTISGFDLQVLWDRSKSIHPPHHINLLSVDGVSLLARRCGLEVVELTTPGVLDVDIVANALQEDPALPVPRFVRALLAAPEGGAREAFQQFLQTHRLSSHLHLVARRPGNAGEGDGR